MVWSQRQVRPSRVYQAVSDQLAVSKVRGHPTQEPPWFRAMQQVPPSETLVRTASPRHNASNPRAKKPKNVYRPQQLHYVEDSLRTAFFKDHPWELARPRVVVETDGKDGQRRDWSTGLRQPGMLLSGESVVQRQLYLMETQNMGRSQAYDVTRREFYRLRQEEEIERRIALEEARHVGAYFGKTRLDVGMQLEDREYEFWKVWAGKQTARREAIESAQLETFGAEEEGEAGRDPLDGPPPPDGGVAAGAGAKTAVRA